ncbi:MAG: trypsin-like peptidase domain-containing protein, partial [Nitrospinae bacterium]|nr:trypsin-like peptidase domain-containing protein [Nitrospinota bacterium]
HILTNYHVVEDANRIHVRLHDNREYNARIVGTDPVTDLAVLKIFAIKNLPVPAFGSSERLNVGEWVMAIGNPYGLDGTVTVGVVSGKSRSDLGIATFENFLQTDASINPGNSGGPLINIEGEIVGINTAVAAIGAGVGFAIPIEMARAIGEELVRKGQVERGWLGVGIQPLTPDLARSFNMPELEGGVVVNNVDSETPAIKGGMQRGDIIVQFDGRSIANAKNFQQMVASARIGRVIPIKIIRDGHEKTLEIKIGKMEY